MEYVLAAGLVASWLLLIVSWAILYQLIQQNGRILNRLETIEERVGLSDPHDFEVDEYHGTLPRGVPAPPIDLPDLQGTVRSLAEWRGKRVLLVFFDPKCVFSRQLLPYLSALASEPVPGRPEPLIVSTGDADANRTLFDMAGYTQPVLLQRATEVAAAYKVDGTPASYLVEADGTLAGELASGVQATLILAGEMASVADATNTDRLDLKAAPPWPGAAERLRRDGLPEGTLAPIFRLPRLEGGEVSLLEFRGKPVVVVFTDPECEPCEALAPQLEKAHRDSPDLPILLIGRGEPDANRAMAERHDLSLPIAIQRHWEISGEYGMFAAPAAFYIDEWGVIAAEVAVGPEAILKLVSSVAHDAVPGG